MKVGLDQLAFRLPGRMTRINDDHQHPMERQLLDGRLHSGQAAPVQLIVDGSDSNTARYVVNYANVIAATAANSTATPGASAGYASASTFSA